MGLAVVLTDFQADDDPEYQGHLNKQLKHINRLLKANKLPKYEGPIADPVVDSRAKLQGFPYSWLHYLRRAIAFARQQPKKFKPVKGNADPSEDPLIDDELSIYMDRHLICHSDCEGYYAPYEFSEPLFDSKPIGKGIAGDIMGSSYEAMKELILVAPLIDIPLKDGEPTKAIITKINKEQDEAHPCWIERKVWLCLYEAMRLSIANRLFVKYS